jgi:threonine/homoserine/homoserine lactone efflux protein
MFLFLGLLFVFITFIGFAIVTIASGKIHSWMINKPGAGKKMHQFSGAMILLLGLKIAFEGKRV